MLGNDPPIRATTSIPHTDDEVEAVIVRTLESTPRDAHGLECLLDGRDGWGIKVCARIWKAFGLRPHRSGTFKVRDMVGLCLDPPERALVLWCRWLVLLRRKR
jgi:hypothetical protein